MKILLAGVTLTAIATMLLGCGGPTTADIEGRLRRLYLDSGIGAASRAIATCHKESGQFSCSVEVDDRGGSLVCADHVVAEPDGDRVHLVHENGSCNYGTSY